MKSGISFLSFCCQGEFVHDLFPSCFQTVFHFHSLFSAIVLTVEFGGKEYAAKTYLNTAAFEREVSFASVLSCLDTNIRFPVQRHIMLHLNATRGTALTSGGRLMRRSPVLYDLGQAVKGPFLVVDLLGRDLDTVFKMNMSYTKYTSLTVAQEASFPCPC